MKRAFTLVELLVVVSIIALLMGILMPVASRAREQAKVVVVNAELTQIGLALEMYMADHDNEHPPTRKDCAMVWEDLVLPPELTEGRYLVGTNPDTGALAGMEDRFNRGHTYKYCAVGPLIQNGQLMKKKTASLYVPAGFPDRCPEGPPEEDIRYDDPANSPVNWVVYSQGPRFDAWEMIKELHCPVPRRTWYDPAKRKGVLVRMRLKNSRQIGSFQGR